jgi:hypothetical protein
MVLLNTFLSKTIKNNYIFSSKYDGLITWGLFTYPVTKTLDGTCGLLRIRYSPLLRQSLLAGNKPLKEAKGRFKISIDALYSHVKYNS